MSKAALEKEKEHVEDFSPEVGVVQGEGRVTKPHHAHKEDAEVGRAIGVVKGWSLLYAVKWTFKPTVDVLVLRLLCTLNLQLVKNVEQTWPHIFPPLPSSPLPPLPSSPLLSLPSPPLPTGVADP